jgi:hypothetical protein
MAANAGRIDQPNRHAVDAEGLLDGVASGPGDIRDDGALDTQQGVEQRRLSGIGRADDGHAEALAQQPSALAVAHQAPHPVAYPSEADCERLPVGFGHFIGKIDRAGHLLERRCQFGPQRGDLVG